VEGSQWKVGELAERLGLTVRTLHHWDELGLLRPSRRTAAGHRLYGEEDLVRLQRILSLRQLGLPLDEIRTWLERPDRSLADDLEDHLGRVRREIVQRLDLCQRLERVARRLRTTGTVSVDALLDSLEATMEAEKYFTPEQMAELRRREQSIGPEAMAAAQRGWEEIIPAVREAMARGADPLSPEVQALAKRWKELVEMFTQGNPGLAQSAQKYWQEGGDKLRQRHPASSPDPEMFAFIGKALKS
jgi:DNA-binding transcriptional MerR regulator